MKKLSLILIGLLAFVACQNQAKKASSSNEETVVLTVDELQNQGDDLLGKVVLVKGTVSHVCKQSGQRCFLMGSSEDVTIRVEAGSKIGSFTQDQMGSDLVVSGVLNEIRIDDAYIDEMEASATEGESANKGHAMGHAGEGNHEVDGGNHENNQMTRIAEMREEIANSEKGYLSIYYLDGKSIEEQE
ncbi:hypothetical protein ACUNWD_03290 [Sunxiuqinia sp. A32]|uniref:hypothetical protein n=1 Tax=Sunxiuqinia sp. A32 TaxID=3461496 RepID=UPI004045C2AC